MHSHYFYRSRHIISFGAVLYALFFSGGEAISHHASGRRDGEYLGGSAHDWPLVGGNWSNSRYSKLSQIDVTTVRDLRAAWISDKFEEGGTSRSPPVIQYGLLFITAGRYVYALDARTGKRVWEYKTVSDETDRAIAPARANSKAGEKSNRRNGVPNGKGVGVGAGLVFVGLKDGHVIALRQRTGSLVWATQTGISQPKSGQWAAVAPTYANGIIFTGLSDGDHNQRGRLTALDAATGQLKWQMFSIPGPGTPGHETWPTFNDAWKFGGGGVWTNPPVDPDLGLVYFTAGNAVPAYAGDWRPGANLYTSSVLAVDIQTGQLKWHFQLVHHDVYEADLGVPIVLYDANVKGSRKRALAVMRADGYLFQLDRATGRPLLPVEERAVPQLESQRTSPTQPYPAKGESILMSCAEWKKEPIPAGFVLGCMWTPPAAPLPSTDPPNVLAPFPAAKGSLMAYSPDTKYFYAQGNSWLHWPRRSQDPYFLNLVGVVPGLKAYAELAAVDSQTGRVIWRRRSSGLFYGGGPLVSAGGLMFQSSNDGTIKAYDAANGEIHWQFQLGSNGGAAATYELDGEQYIALTAGTRTWAFKLGGQLSPIPVNIPRTAEEDDFPGILVDTDEIETTSLHRSLIEPGTRYFVDEYTFNPYRARVKVGTKVTFVNNGSVRHELVETSGSWSTGLLSPAQEAWITFDAPGRYVYTCKNHPWSYGQIVVVENEMESTIDPSSRIDSSSPVRGDAPPSDQLARGRDLFTKNCGACHGDDLSGRSAAPALVGPSFVLKWGAATVADLLDNVSVTMPQERPGALPRGAYIDIVAYLLSENNSAAKIVVLEDRPESLRSMKVIVSQ